MGILEIIVLTLFIFAGFGATIWRNLRLGKLDRKQESAIADLMVENLGQQVRGLSKKLGDPYEIETLKPGWALYVWKFPPSKTLPQGRGLVTLTATTSGEVIVDISWKRRTAS